MNKKAGKRRYFLTLVLLILVGCALNLLADLGEAAFGVRILFGNFGTIIVSVLGGALPGVLSAVFSSLAMGAYDGSLIFFAVVGTLFALIASLLRKKRFFEKLRLLIVPVLIFTAVDGLGGGAIRLFLRGSGNGGDSLFSAFAARLGIADPTLSFFAATVIESFISCLFAVVLTYLFLRILPEKFKDRIKENIRDRNGEAGKRRIGKTLLARVVTVVLIAGVSLGTISFFLGFYLYREVAFNYYTDVCRGVTDAAALVIDPERVGEYIDSAGTAADYAETESKLYGIIKGFPQVKYLYSYRIERDVGCRVVFDLDVDGVEGSDIGSVVPFDESFTDLLPSLYAGEKIDPIITNDTYGWLLTVYNPIYDGEGNCVCYVAADVSMDKIITDETVFVVKLLSLFVSFTVLIMVTVVEMFKLKVIYPIDDMADATGSFVYDSEEGREKSLSRLRTLDVDSTEEINGLHTSICRMAEDTNGYIDRIRAQAELIEKLRDDIIIDFAEMIESRDKCTGDHVKKTAFYVEAIARELIREGKYPDVLNDEYVARLVRSAPLHDVGKIKVSDVILNKPARLTDEEYSVMKTHTTSGRDILVNSSAMSDSDDLLKEAVEMASFHHEKWDGTGYPSGAKGEEIPLSARIMAVADVFDALVSERSYKKPYSFEEALSIIKDGSGNHFDPEVVSAFLAIAEDAYKEYMKKKR